MSRSFFMLGAFGDEIDDDFATQLALLRGEGLGYIELRSAWGRNVLDLDQEALGRVRSLLQQYGISVSAIGSPIGKSEISRPPEYELERLQRAIVAAQTLDTRLIRIFSFYIPRGAAAAWRGEVLRRMTALARVAERAGVTLLHENEKGIYGDTPARCLEILDHVDSPALRLAFDPANFVQEGLHPVSQGWPLLGRYTSHVHIKDALLADGSIRLAGQGDGQIPALLEQLVANQYRGFLTLEPHLLVAGSAGGLSGQEGMRAAIGALRDLLQPLADRVELR